MSTGALVLLALGFLTPLFYYIPSPTLAAVIIMAVVDMVDFSLLGHLWRVKSESPTHTPIVSHHKILHLGNNVTAALPHMLPAGLDCFMPSWDETENHFPVTSVGNQTDFTVHVGCYHIKICNLSWIAQ